MAGSYNSQANPGAMLPTTYDFDPSVLYDVEVTSPEFKELIIRLAQNMNRMLLVLNLKDTGYYTLEEFLNSQAFFPNPALNSTTAQTPVFRQAFRKVINFGALPNATTTSVAHNINITSGYSFTRIYGTATNPSTAFIPIPFSSPTLNQNIKITVDGTNVSITTGIDYSAYTICYVVLEYIKS